MEKMVPHFDKWFLGNDQAIHFAALVWNATQEWDDIYDEKKVDQTSTLLQFMAFGMDHQPFFRANRDTLRPALLMVYLNWRDANVLEATGAIEDLQKAYMLRASIYSFYVLMAWIVGGEDHSARVGPEIQRFYGETFEEYAKEFQNA